MSQRPDSNGDYPVDRAYADNNSVTDQLWRIAGLLFLRRRIIIISTAVITIAAVVLSLLIPNRYDAVARLLPPEAQGNSITTSALRNLPSAAAMLLGGVSGDYARYLTILSSRVMLESVVDEFNLIDVYETADKRHPKEAAIEQLRDNIDFPVHEKYEYLSVVVRDKDPTRAADLANFLVHRLNEINSHLSSQNAALFRQFVEGRYSEAAGALDSLLNARQSFQNTYGVFDLPTQTAAFLDQVAALRAEAVKNEIQYNALREQLGDDNIRVRGMRDIVDAANQQYLRAFAGQERVLPVPHDQLSQVMREYIDLERETLIQGQIIEVLAPVREQARLNQEQEVQAVQLVDPAIPPVKKATPRRSIIVILAMVSGFLIVSGLVLTFHWWGRNSPMVARRLHDATRSLQSSGNVKV